MDTFSQVRRPGRPTAPVGSPVEKLCNLFVFVFIFFFFSGLAEVRGVRNVSENDRKEHQKGTCGHVRTGEMWRDDPLAPAVRCRRANAVGEIM